jgi:WD40 repeat protein
MIFRIAIATIRYAASPPNLNDHICKLILLVNQIATLENHTGNVTAVAFHCEGKWLATGSEDGTIKIWDMRYARTLNSSI